MTVRDNHDWVRDLEGRGADQAAALSDLRAQLLGRLRKAWAGRDCVNDELLEDLSTYLEATPSGKSSDTFRLVREHLDLCPDCREEIELMIKAIEPQGQ